MAQIVGEDFRKHLEDPPSLLPIYCREKSEKNLVEEAFGHMGSFMDPRFFFNVLLYEFSSCGEEERDSCKHV